MYRPLTRSRRENSARWQWCMEARCLRSALTTIAQRRPPSSSAILGSPLSCTLAPPPRCVESNPDQRRRAHGGGVFRLEMGEADREGVGGVGGDFGGEAVDDGANHEVDLIFLRAAA